MKKDFATVFKYTQIALWGGVLFAILFFTGVNYGLLGEMPDLEEIQNPHNDISTTVFSSDYEVLGTYFTENRIEVSYDELSPYLVQALIATEDKRFYTHGGIDLKGLFRAIIKTGLLGMDAGGGSTITQQLAKNLFNKKVERNRFKRMLQKIKEWVLTAKLERTFSKEEIINIYLNTIGFGYNSYGIKTASFTYFYKKPKDLNVEEAALLIGMLNGPSLYNPQKRPELAKSRRNLVLRRMYEAGYLNEAQFKKYSEKPIKLNFRNPDYREGVATYFREYLRQELKNWCEKNPKPDGSKWDIYKDGLRVFTTIDYRMQQHAEEAARSHLAYLQKAFFKEWKGREPWKSGLRAKPDLPEKMMKQSERYQMLKEQGKSEAEIRRIFNQKVEMRVHAYDQAKGVYSKDTVMSPLDSIKYYLQMVQVGFIALDPKTGEIKAWVGGPNITFFQLDHVKKTTKRQVGSTIKPFQYAIAVERGYTPCTLIPYEPPHFEGIDAAWNPNATNKWEEGSLVPMQEGLVYSDNRITAQLMKEFGPESLVQFCRNLGVESPLDAVPALCLGVSDISVFEMARAYTAFANNGTISEPYFIKRIEDKNGNKLAEYYPSRREALDELTVWVTNGMLRQVVERGTASKLRSRYGLTMPLAGKTGTTQSNADAWFVAYTPEIVTVCWVGFDQPAVHFLSSATGQGSAAALPIVGDFLRRVFADKSLKIARNDFPTPEIENIHEITFDCSTTTE
ncbi:MAG: transglycosylase domain-containing protein [Chitinophagales bacterium]|nr:transglycosylase domain-containing protein [Chitinophagales bacterium]